MRIINNFQAAIRTTRWRLPTWASLLGQFRQQSGSCARLLKKCVPAKLFVLLLGVHSLAASAPPNYDVFTGDNLNITKWTPLFVPLYAQEWRRTVANGTLNLYLRGVSGSSDPDLIGGHASILNGIALAERREKSARTFETQIIIESADVEPCNVAGAEISESMFLIANSWFNDGSGAADSDEIGDIRTSLAVSHNTGTRNQFDIVALVYRWNGEGITELFRQSLGVVGFGTMMVIRTTWDEPAGTFRFFRSIQGIGQRTAEIDYTAFTQVASGPGNPFHVLQARAEPAYCGDKQTFAEVDVRIRRVAVANSARGN